MIDSCTIPRSTQFCDESGNDIVPICMVNIRHFESNIEEAWCIEDAITFSEVSSTEEDYLTYKQSELGYTNEHNEDSTDDDVVPESELEKIHLLLMARDFVELDFTKLDLKKIHVKQRSDRKKKQAQSRGRRRQPKIHGTSAFLLHVGAVDGLKAHKKWKSMLQYINDQKGTKTKSKESRRGRLP